jgi:hypothetical protein
MKLVHPFTSLVCGPTSCGKTSLVKNIIEFQCIEPKPARILWCYSEDQPLYKSIKGQITFFKGLPDSFDELFDGKSPGLIVIDDLMTQVHSDERITRLFSVGSHHRNVSVFLIVHNLFHQGTEMRNLSLNSQYIFLFKNPRDKLQLSILARQMYPRNTKFVSEAYEDATKNAYGYLLFDLKQETESALRVRTGVLPVDTPYVYIPSDS